MSPHYRGLGIVWSLNETSGTNITEQWVLAWNLYYRGFVNGPIRSYWKIKSSSSLLQYKHGEILKDLTMLNHRILKKIWNNIQLLLLDFIQFFKANFSYLVSSPWFRSAVVVESDYLKKGKETNLEDTLTLRRDLRNRVSEDSKLLDTVASLLTVSFTERERQWLAHAGPIQKCSF